MITNAIYTSVFDDCIVCSSVCRYDTERKRCFDIETAANADEAEDANALTDEYVTANGKDLRADDGVRFEY